MVILFNKEITVESVQELIYQLNEIQEQGILYFQTNGGDIIASEALTDYLNVFMQTKLTIVFTGVVASAGVHVMTMYMGDKFLSENLDLIVLHATDRTMGHTREPKYVSNLKNYDKKLSDIWLSRMEDIVELSPADKKLYKKGEDIIIERKDFHKIKIPLWNTEKDDIFNFEEGAID